MGTVAQRSSKVLLDKIKLSSKNMNKTFINLCQHFTQGLGWSSKNIHKKFLCWYVKQQPVQHQDWQQRSIKWEEQSQLLECKAKILYQGLGFSRQKIEFSSQVWIISAYSADKATQKAYLSLWNETIAQVI